MSPVEIGSPQDRMNAHSRRVLEGLLARAEGDRAATAKAQARLDTLRAALDIYAASHLVGHGARPWPREVSV